MGKSEGSMLMRAKSAPLTLWNSHSMIAFLDEHRGIP